MNINHAILHIFDAQSAVTVFSEAELEFDTRAVKSFVTKHLKRSRNAADNHPGSFTQESAFAAELKRYFFGERTFIDLSEQIAEFLCEQLSHAEKPSSADILVADFEDDEETRWFAILIMESRMAFMHEVANDAGTVAAKIARHHAILPAPTQKIASYALVRSRDLAVLYQDKPRTIMGADTQLIVDGLLQCTTGTSAKEVIDTVTRAVAEAAEEHGANAAVALAATKAAMVEQVEVDEELPPWDIVDEVFAEEPALQATVRQKLEEEHVPERVSVERAHAERPSVRSQKIRTDTGIEITFPVEMSKNSEYIAFKNEPNGLISIELKNIGAIESR
ncbi:nucleoid-associated protein [uncultured Enorma sp.]|uniref:nucleoid-associated protein n=1 Tax=uncultured Enorma sp. TaxID=1714346 RepID=UPI00265F0464|nr:nucleoid-associated protein [uncultured Enorma sp.]